jgi:hypothetical protein
MPGLSNPADFLMRIINEDDVRIGHEATIRETKEDLFEKNYMKGSSRQILPEFTPSSVRSISRMLANQEFLEIENKEAKLKKLYDAEVSDLYAERIGLFIRTYQTYKEPISYEFDQSKETDYQNCTLAYPRPSHFYILKKLMVREYTLYFRAPIIIMATFISMTVFGVFF